MLSVTSITQRPACKRYKNTKANALSAEKLCFRGVDIKIGENAIKDLKPCNKLIVLAHPDDETCFFGFISKLLKNANETVQLIYTTSGQNGQDIRHRIRRGSPRIKEQRLRELENALNVIGLKENPLVLDLYDGKTNTPENRGLLLSYLKKIISQTQPKTIYSFDSSGITGHTDHIIAGRMTNTAINRLKLSNDINFFTVGLTQYGADEIIKRTQDYTDIFKYARASITKPFYQSYIKEEIPTLIEAFSKYVTQFKKDSLPAIKNYLEANPYINFSKIKTG